MRDSTLEQQEHNTATKFSKIGKLVDSLHLDYLNPHFASYPSWDGEREIVLIDVNNFQSKSNFVCTSGLALGDEAFELYLQANEVISDFYSSWQINLIYQIGEIIPKVPNFIEVLDKYGYLSLQLKMEGAPDEWSLDHQDGNISVFIGLQNDFLDGLGINEFRMANVKLMRPEEALHAIENGQAGREFLAMSFAQEDAPTLSHLNRVAVV